MPDPNASLFAGWNNPLEKLRSKWHEVPAGDGRVKTTELLDCSDRELLDFWLRTRASATTGPAFDVRGWYHCLYAPVLKGKKLMDVGSGLGIDGITFAENGADITFVDIVESNLDLIKRLCKSLNLVNVHFHYMADFNSLEKLPADYDVIWCQGSMINLPFEIACQETQALLEHLPIGGRWIELAYPKERWVKEGRMPFDKWGEKTEGWAPWVEWYDKSKFSERFAPARFNTLLHFNFYNDDFNWFDVIRTQ
jgi:hypothetical protein